MESLQEIGFRRAGSWAVESGSLKLLLDIDGSKYPALYAFVLDGNVAYVGKTIRPIARRLYGYLRPGHSQKTNARINTSIIQALTDESSVDIWVFIDSCNQTCGQFKVNMAAGLEDDIIAKLNPKWNHKSRFSQCTKHEEKILNDRLIREEKGMNESLRPNFTVVIHPTYFNQGFFNVPVDFSRYFDRNGKDLEIHCDGLEVPINGKINRTANQGTNAPRIMGRAKLRDWFHENVRQGSRVRVRVKSPTQILLTKA